MKCLRLSRVGVVLLRLRIGLFQIIFKWVKLRVFSKLLKTCSATEELDSCRLIREDNGPIRFGTMTDDYREVFAALKSRGRAIPASNWSISNCFQVGQTPGSCKLLKTCSATEEFGNSILHLFRLARS
jgi:hypothetical protein